MTVVTSTPLKKKAKTSTRKKKGQPPSPKKKTVQSQREEELLELIRAAGMPEPVRQLWFAWQQYKRKWAFDFAWPAALVACEVQGGVHLRRGGHTSGVGFTGDREKMNRAQLMGWLVIEATPAHIKSGQAIEWLAEALAKRKRGLDGGVIIQTEGVL